MLINNGWILIQNQQAISFCIILYNEFHNTLLTNRKDSD